MVNNSTNINKTKESFNSDGRHSSNINKPKESLNSAGQQTPISTNQRKVCRDGEQFIQYQQTKRKFEQWWSTIPLISTKQKNIWTVIVGNSSNINKPKESLNRDGKQFLQYQQTKRKFEHWWSIILPISTNQKKV